MSSTVAVVGGLFTRPSARGKSVPSSPAREARPIHHVELACPIRAIRRLTVRPGSSRRSSRFARRSSPRRRLRACPRRASACIAVAVLVIGLWCTEALPAGVTSLILIVALVLSGGVPGFPQALAGFADPVAYFLIGVLTIGLAVSRSGLAERVARFFLRRSRGNARSLYLQLLLAFPLLTIILPSATTRTGILVYVYEQALELAQVPRRAPLASAIMMALNSINRLASTILLTGGITPVVAAALIGGVYWSQWLLLMSVPYLALLTIGSAADLLPLPPRIRREAAAAARRATRRRCRAARCARSRSPSAPRRCGSPIRYTTGTRSCRRCSRGSCCSCRASACSPGASSSATSAGPISSCSRRRSRSPARSPRAARARGSRS